MSLWRVICVASLDEFEGALAVKLLLKRLEDGFE